MLPHNPFWPEHTMYFKSLGSPSVAGERLNPFGGGFKGSTATVPFNRKLGQALGILDTPGKQSDVPVTPTASAPVTASNAEVLQAENDMRRQALKKMGYGKTIFAGETGVKTSVKNMDAGVQKLGATL